MRSALVVGRFRNPRHVLAVLRCEENRRLSNLFSLSSLHSSPCPSNTIFLPGLAPPIFSKEILHRRGFGRDYELCGEILKINYQLTRLHSFVVIAFKTLKRNLGYIYIYCYVISFVWILFNSFTTWMINLFLASSTGFIHLKFRRRNDSQGGRGRKLRIYRLAMLFLARLFREISKINC